MKHKSEQVKELVAAGDYKKALSIAKSFKIGFTKEQQSTMTRAYECIVHPDFYKQIGTDIDKAIEAGVELIKQVYGN